MTRRSTAEQRRTRLVEICTALPEASSGAGQHIRFDVRGRTFAYYLNDHHGDGRISLCCKVPPGEHTAIVKADPERFFVPAYLGAKGWLGLRLDLPRIDWGEVERVVRDSYQLVAPKRLAASARPARR